MTNRGPHTLMDRLDARSEHTDKATGADPMVTRLKRAAIFHLNGDGVEAERQYRAILDDDPDNRSATNNLGLLLLTTGRRSEALDVFDSLGSEDELSPTALTNLGIARIEDGDMAGGIRLFERAVSLAPDSPAWMSLGKARLLSRDIDGAARAFQEVVRRFPDHASAWRLLGGCFAAVENQDAALTALERSVELDPTEAAAWRQLGVVLLARRDFGSAVTVCRRATELDPTSVDGRRQLAAALVAAGNVPAAISELQVTVDDHKQRDRHSGAMVDLGVLYLSAGEYERTVELLSPVTQEDADYERAQLYLGFAHLAVGEELAARSVLEELTKNEGRFSEQAGVALADL